MVSGKTSEELPPGWKEAVKVKNGRKTKYFTHLATGQKFYSRPSVMRYVNSLDISQGTSPSIREQDNESTPCKSEVPPDNVQTNESPDWLPSGWTMESRIRKSGSSVGSVYKIYTDPITGSKFYSKPQVLKYLQGIENKNAEGKEKPRVSDVTPLKQQDISQHYESVEGKIHFSGEDKNGLSNPSLKDMDENNVVGEIPAGNIRETRSRKHGRGMIKGQQDASQASESVKGKNHLSAGSENDAGKPSLKIDYSDVQDENGSDGLPPGWIKETKSRKFGSGIRKEPYYIDSASGYVFRSRKDVMRYLETGDIRSCVVKPQKRDISELKVIKDGNNPSTSTGGNKSGELAEGRQLFVGQKPENGKECSQPSTAAAEEAEQLKDKGSECVSEKSKEEDVTMPALTTKLTASKTEADIGLGTFESDKSGNSESKAEGYTQDMKMVPDNVADITDIKGFHELKLAENPSDSKTKKEERKSRKRTPPNMPGRSSKRLAGHEPEMQPNFSLTERALRAAVKKHGEVEADTSSRIALNAAADEVPHQPVTEAETTKSSSLAYSEAANEVSLQPVTDAETTKSISLALSAAADEVSQQPVIHAETTKSISLALNAAADEVSQQPVTHAETTKSSSLALDTAADEVSQQHVTEAETIISSTLALNTVVDGLPRQPVNETETTRSSSFSLNIAADEVSREPVNQMQTSSSSSLALNIEIDQVPQQPVTNAEPMVASQTSLFAEATLETDLRNNSEVPSENQMLQQTIGQGGERQVEENPLAQGDYWSDPCWDFAFKTLTGAIPLEDTLTLQGCFPQQAGTSYNQENLNFGMPEFELPPIFQNDVPQPDPVQNNVPADQLSTNPTLTPSGNISMPSCSSQPPSLEARSKDYQTKVNS